MSFNTSSEEVRLQQRNCRQQTTVQSVVTMNASTASRSSRISSAYTTVSYNWHQHLLYSVLLTSGRTPQTQGKDVCIHAVADPEFANGGPRSSAAGASIGRVSPSPHPHWAVPPPQKFVFNFRSKNVTSSAFWALFFAVHVPIVQARNTAFGLTKLAACNAQHRDSKTGQTQACWKVEAFYKYPL